MSITGLGDLAEINAARLASSSLASGLVVPAATLDPTADTTFDRWLNLPAWDHRTIEEFAADGGKPDRIPSVRDCPTLHVLQFRSRTLDVDARERRHSHVSRDGRRARLSRLDDA